MNKRYNTVPLSEVLIHYQDYIDEPEPITYPKLSVKLYGKGAVLDTSVEGSSLKMKKHQIAKRGQVILSEIWGKKGAIGIVPPEGNEALCTSHFFLFDIRDDKIDQKYLQAIFTANYLEEQLNVEAQGTTGYAAVRPKHLLAATIPLPPIEEQRRIVARIEELAAKIEEARGLHQSLLKEFEYLCDENIFKSFVGPSRFIYEIANVTKLAGFEYTEYFTNAEPGDVKVIRAGNVRNEGLDLTYTPTISKQISDMLPRSKLFPGDIVMTFIGANIGDVTFVPVDCVNLHCGPNVSKITPSKEISHLYLAYALRSPSIKKQIQEITKNTAQPSLSMKTIRSLSIPVPPFDKQIELVNQMGKIEEFSAKAKKMLDEITKELNALLPSILDKAFKGEL